MESQKNKNFLPLSRKILDHDLWQEKPFGKGQAWIDLLLLARWKDEPKTIYIKNQKYIINRGQLVYSMKSLAKRWGWDRAKVKRLLDRLQIEHQIEHHSDNVTTCISIIKYNSYNQGEHQTNTERTPNEHQTNTKEEGEERKEGEDKKVSLELYEKRNGIFCIEDILDWIDKNNLDKYKVKTELENFRDKCFAKGYKYANFKSAFYGWIKNENYGNGINKFRKSTREVY